MRVTMPMSDEFSLEPSDTLAFFIPSLNGGGAERVIVSLANGFAARGFNVDLVLVRNTGVYRSEVSERVRIVDLHGRRTLGSIIPLTRYLARNRPRTLISAMNYANVVAILARLLARVDTRLVVTEHANLSQAMADARPAVSQLLPRLMRASYRKAHAIVAVSDGVADDLSATLGLARQSILTCHNPIETAELRQKSLQTLNHPWAQSDALPLIVAAGRLSKEKDFATLIRAFECLRPSTPSRLVILGEGGERSALEDQICQSPFKDDILLAGFQPNPYNWMRAASVFVLSSRWEGFGNVLVEAMACGTPVVSTACPSGPEEILEHGKWGRLSPVGDPRALAEALRETLSDTTHPDVRLRAEAFGIVPAVDAYLEVLRPNPALAS